MRLVEKGVSPPCFHQHVDGYQAYYADRTQRSNPYKRNPQSGEFIAWKQSYLKAKDVDQRGLVEDRDKHIAAQAYWERHKKP